MEYSEQAVMNLLAADNLSIEEEIQANILNFIRMIHINQLDFIESAFDSAYFGALPMTFKKNPGQVMGLITATVDGEMRQYVFTDEGYESMADLMVLMAD